MKLEHKNKPLLPRKKFIQRLMIFAVYSFVILAGSLLLGLFGYHFFGKLSWIDSLVNASMILTGMGPVDQMQGTSAKLFESAYALYSGVAFLTTVAVLFAPVVHRFLHKMHIDDNEM